MKNNVALYGSVPFMISHKLDASTGTSTSVGLFWLNAAETWVDVTRSADDNFGFVVGGASALIIRPSSPLQFQSAKSRGSVKPSISTTTHWMSETGVLEFFVVLGGWLRF